MTIYNYSELGNGSQTAFDPEQDVLVVDGTGIVQLHNAPPGIGPLVAAGFAVYSNNDAAEDNEGINLIQLSPIGASPKNIDLLFSAAPGPTNVFKITSSNFTFAAGSVLLVGDNSTGAGDDTTALTLNGTVYDDHLISFGGSQILNGGDGYDTLETRGGLTEGLLGSGTDVFNGGLGNDVLWCGYVEDLIGYTVNLALGTGSISAGSNSSSFTLSGIEAVDGSEGADSITGDAGFNNLFGWDGNDTLDGGSGFDGLFGMNGNDRLIGGGDFDVLYGDAGNDTLDGGTGADIMYGGSGNDTYIIDNAGDMVTENASEGKDLVQSAITFVLGANVEKLTLTGTSAINGTGNTQANVITGNDAANSLKGSKGNDTLKGSGGADKLYGGAGNDSLTGGLGKDKFVFQSALNATTNKDTIVDFASGTDKLWLDDDIFTALGPVTATTTIASPNFYAGTAAHDADDRIIYDQGTGALYYDADGNLGGSAQVQFATLGTTTHPTLAYTDIQIIA